MKNVFFLVVVFCIITNACNERDTFEFNVPNNQLNIIKNEPMALKVSLKSNNIAFLYEANGTENATTSSLLRIFDLNNGNTPIAEISFLVDASKTAFKMIQHERVIQEAKKVSNSLKDFDTNLLVNLYEAFGRKIVADSKLNPTSNLVQSLFFHNAILNTVNRSKKNNTDCGCNPYGAYLVGKTSFWCQEDYYLNPEVALQYIEKVKYQPTEKEMPMYNFLVKNRNEIRVSIDQLTKTIEPNYGQKIVNLYNMTTSQKNARVVACKDCPIWGICGNQLGCCGNYSGCCILATMDCLDHDVACIKCDHWYCGPACVPGTPAPE